MPHSGDLIPQIYKEIEEEERYEYFTQYIQLLVKNPET